MIKLTEEQRTITQELEKWILNYVAPVFFITGLPPNEKVVGNATVSFIECGENNLFAVTNDHVIQKFESFKEENLSAKIRFNNLEISLKERLIDRDTKIDLATFRITSKELEMLDKGKQAIFCRNWPPTEPNKEDIVLFAGFPQIFRQQISTKECQFEAVPILELITDISEESMKSSFDRENWEKFLGCRELSELGTKFGGFSGASAFTVGPKDKIMVPKLVGFVFEYAPDFDTIFIRHANCLTSEGKIKRDNISSS